MYILVPLPSSPPPQLAHQHLPFSSPIPLDFWTEGPQGLFPRGVSALGRVWNLQVHQSWARVWEPTGGSELGRVWEPGVF